MWKLQRQISKHIETENKVRERGGRTDALFILKQLIVPYWYTPKAFDSVATNGIWKMP